MPIDPTKPTDGDYLNQSVADIRNNFVAAKEHIDDRNNPHGVTASQINAELAFPPGTKMIFCQASAPPGWTKDDSYNDRMLRVVNGTSGGGIGGSWTISGLSVSVAGHALTIAEMPSHTHNIIGYWMDVSSGSWPDLNADQTSYSKPTTATGGGGSHSHGASISHNGTWRPSYVDVIVCIKN